GGQTALGGRLRLGHGPSRTAHSPDRQPDPGPDPRGAQRVLRAADTRGVVPDPGRLTRGAHALRAAASAALESSAAGYKHVKYPEWRRMLRRKPTWLPCLACGKAATEARPC